MNISKTHQVVYKTKLFLVTRIAYFKVHHFKDYAFNKN